MGDAADRPLEEPNRTCTAPASSTDSISSFGNPIARSSLPSPLKSAFISMALTSENKKVIDKNDNSVNEKIIPNILILSNVSLKNLYC